MKATDVRCIFRKNDVARELPGSEPEGEVRDIVELKFCVNPAEVNRTRRWVCIARGVRM